MDEIEIKDSNELNFAQMFNYGKPMFNVLSELLADRTTGKNIVWATDTYSEYGVYYSKERQMFPDFNINLIMSGVLLPRVQKTEEQQKSRTKAKAEVFTPSWICNKMNNFCDMEWFGRNDVFNIENEEDHTWIPVEENIAFAPKEGRIETWKKYVDSRRIEITCGEAPYLVSRYDTTTGEPLEIKKRIGMLDRKLRVVGENTNTEKDWIEWAIRALQSTYGFEYQGDNLFFARVNLVQTFIDYYEDKFNKEPELKYIQKIATIVSWNLWQMDGLKDTVPFGIPSDEFYQMSLFDENKEDTPVYCKIKNWRDGSGRILEYRDLKGDK